MSLRNWTRQRWVDVANKKRGGGYPCGRRKGERREETILNVYLLLKLEICRLLK